MSDQFCFSCGEEIESGLYCDDCLNSDDMIYFGSDISGNEDGQSGENQ